MLAQPGGCCTFGQQRARVSPPASTSSLNEFQEIPVDRLGIGGEHAMRETGIELKSGVLKELHLEQGSTFVRNDLVVFALHDERRYFDALQVLGEVRFGERLDTIVVAPPIMPWRHQFPITPSIGLAPGRLNP